MNMENCPIAEQLLSRKLHSSGVAVMSVRYASDELERVYAKSGTRDVEILWDPENLGAISVFLDGIWHEVHAVLDWFDGVPVDVWSNLRSVLREFSNAAHSDFQPTITTQVSGE
ncbi:Mu transposase C-terminal domain-containing protein [Roseovarius sp. D0-M9]|uniref:Mu transposase C-terminal domain-containing protein n=1 Tax=Roseovarius sp. D0-M9 TaxID=3127117 RepID=UPI0030105E30